MQTIRPLAGYNWGGGRAQVRWCKHLCLLCALALAAASLGGCGVRAAIGQQAPAPSTTMSDRETVVLLHTWPEKGKILNALAAQINDSQDQYELRLVSKSTLEAEEYVSTALASQAMTDLYAAEAPLMEAFLRLDGAKPLDTSLAEDRCPCALNSFLREGELFALPLFVDGAVLVANLEYLQEAGLALPQSREDLAATLETLKEELEVNVPLAVSSRPRGGSLMRLRSCVTDALLLESGCQDRDDVSNWDGAVARGAIVLKQWSQEGYFGANYFSFSDEDAMQNFESGRSPFLFCGTSELASLLEEGLDFEIQVMAFPRETGSTASPSMDKRFAGIAICNQSASLNAAPALEAFVQAVAGSWELQAAGWMPVSEEDAAQDVEIAQLWQALPHDMQPCGSQFTPAEMELQSQVFVEYLTSSMTADAFEKGYGNIYQ